MAEDKELKEAQVAYKTAPSDLAEPIILERDGQPVFAILPFEEYRRLREMAERERVEAEAEITATFNEVRKIRYGNRSAD